MAMNIDSSLDLALLGLTLRRATDLPSLCRSAQALMMPWATPTLDVIEGRAIRLAERGALGITTVTVRASPQGRRTFERLMQQDMPEHDHALAMAVEAVKLACLDLLEPPARMVVVADLIAARQRCQLRLSARLAGSEDQPSAVRRGLRHQLRLLESGLEVLQHHLLPGRDGVLASM